MGIARPNGLPADPEASVRRLIACLLLLLFACTLATPTPPQPRPFYDEFDRPLTLCYDEFPEVKPYLDEAWRELQVLTGKRTRKARPRFCFIERPLVFVYEGQTGVLYGYYNKRRNEILLAFTESAKEMDCNAVHEMLHALFGVGHEEPKWSERMRKVGCK